MSNVRNEIKAQIVRAGFTMQEVVDRGTRLVGQRIQPFCKAPKREHPLQRGHRACRCAGL